MPRTADFVVVGAGAVGLTLAREIKRRQRGARILVLEKESRWGAHSSGRNSGVLHSGIYYPPDTLKARVCVAGAREMAAYCRQHRLPINPLGKVIVPVRAEQDPQLELLLSRAQANGARAELLDEHQLRSLEPEARSASGRALWSPDTAVVSPPTVLDQLAAELRADGVEILCGAALSQVDVNDKQAKLTDHSRVGYGHLINAAGLHADRIAHLFGIGLQYTMLPFKGLYYKLKPSPGFSIRHLIYPVPDLRVPFLGVHYTTAISGEVYLGPTAVPAFGRENYRGWQGFRLGEALTILCHMARQYALNKQGFRLLAHIEGRRYFKRYFAEAVRALTPRLDAAQLAPCDKVGIRAQLLDQGKAELVMDFVVEDGPSSTHILNAISPAFTCSFAFARHVAEHHLKV